jgi:hypothetical protein
MIPVFTTPSQQAGIIDPGYNGDSGCAGRGRAGALCLFSAMNRFQSALLIFLIGLAPAPLARAQDSVLGVDPLYPEFAHPREDAFAAIEKRDYRFINVDRHGKDVPGLERYARFVEIYGMRPVKQRFLLFATPSQKFSFILRARAYAEEYNQTVLHYLQQQAAKS